MLRHAHAPTTFGNVRANGVRTLAAYCSARGCHHAGVIEVERYDEVLVPSFGPPMVPPLVGSNSLFSSTNSLFLRKNSLFC